MNAEVMSREQVDQLLEHADDCIRRALARLDVQGGPGVTVNGGIVSVDEPPVTEVMTRRTYSLVIFAQVSMTQNYGTSEPGQVSDLFEYEPRFVGILPATAVDGDYLPGVQGLPMLPTIISADPHPDEDFPGVVYQESVEVPTPSILDKFATVRLYVRGWWDDSPEPEPVFADAFAVGSMTLTTTQNQYITTGDPLEQVPMTEDQSVTATYAGANLLFTAFETDPFTPGDSTATITITSAVRP